MKIRRTWSLFLLLLPVSFAIGRNTAGVQPPEGWIPISDFAKVTIDAADYPCFHLKDYGNIDDDPNRRSYASIIREINSEKSRLLLITSSDERPDRLQYKYIMERGGNMQEDLTTRERQVLISLWEAGEPLTMTALAELNAGLTLSKVQRAINRLLERKYVTEVAAVYHGKIISRFYKAARLKKIVKETPRINTYEKE